MIIAQQKRNENIAEYLLYMWQIEDILRAYHLDINLIELNLISKLLKDVDPLFEDKEFRFFDKHIYKSN